MKQSSTGHSPSDLGRRLANLSPAQRRLLQEKLEKKGIDSLFQPAIPRRPAGAAAPLSFSQRRLWFLDQLEPNSALYNVYKALRLNGSLDVEALTGALSAIVERHEALRTTFHSIDGEPIQVIETRPWIDLIRTDLGTFPEHERVAELDRLLKQEAQRPFNLSVDSMLRARLFRMREQEHVVLLVMHHIASDGWSMGVLFRELAGLYDSFAKGNPTALPQLPIQYADFAVWQREQMQGDLLRTQLSYWTKRLNGIPPLLDLVPDRPRSPVQCHRGRSHPFVLAKELADKLKALGRQQGTTLYMTLLAAFNVLLYRRTGQVDLVVGSPIAGRTRPEVEALIGFFVNTLVLRTDLSGDPTFRELLDRVRERVLEAFSHQDLPFEKLVEALHPKRHAGHRSLVQVAFAFQNVPSEPARFSGLTTTPVPVDFEVAKLDLTLFMWETEGELAGSLNYNADLFEPTTIVALIKGFHVLLEAAVVNPDLPVEKLLSVSASSTTDRKISREEAVDVYELSNLTRNQVLIWAGQKLHPELPTYNVPYQFIISGSLDTDHFRKAFRTLVSSSDALRTVIREIDGLPQQTVLADLSHPIECLDFSGNKNPVAAFKAWVEGRRHKPLDFGEMPLDCALAKLSDREFVWYMNVHHIVSDGWSVGLIFRWVGELYGRSVQMCLEDRIEIPAYRSYVDHERRYRRSQRYVRAETYWKEKLAEKLPPTTFYGKKPRKGTSEVHRISCDLGIDRTTLLKQLATGGDCPALSENASVFNVLAAILFAYLNRVTGLRRHSIGTPVHNRGSRGFNETIGLVMEVLPLRVTIEEDETFRSLILKVQLEASQVFRMCHNIGNSPQSKVYDVLLNYHIASYSSFHDMPVRVERLPTGQDNHSLALQVHDFHRSGSLSIEFDFHSDAFDPAQSRFAVDHFLRMLDAYLADPDEPISQVDLLSEKEKHCLLLEFNRSEVGSYDDICVHQLFERSVERTPDAVALVSHAANLAPAERLQLTYSELNDRANKLAHYLREEGVSRGDRVAVCLDRCAEAVVAILSVLKAGGAYVPLNPNYPAERLLSMLHDSRPALLLTHKQYAASVSVDGIGLICLDTDGATWAQQPARNPTRQQTLDDPVYIVYTSGSTGRSKGVVVSNRSLVNAYLGWEESYQLTSGHTHLQMANLSFDVFSGDLVRGLGSGGKLVICPTEIMLQPALLFQLMREEGVDWAEFVPPVLRELVAYAAANNCRLDFMRGIVCGSDIWSVEDYRECQRLCGPKTRLINSYGVTEATIDSSFFEGALPNGLADARVPIGRPFSRTQLYVLDRSMRPTPMGVPGELHIGGAGLARGYLNRPELTAEKFIANPFSSKPGARLYKTGDLARYLPDGNIEFLGRLDHQVKIRGFRVELGEIEAVLRSHPAVQQAVVTAPQDVARDDKLLVAYVIGSQPGSCSATELHAYLKMKLPSYMLPAAFVFLDALPLTASGKINFQALPPPDGSRIDGSETFMAPRNPIESKMADIWCKLLDLDRVGVRDNFFDLGGHSLMAVRLFAEIEKAFNKRPPLSSLFQEATIESLAKVINQESKSAAPPSLVAIQPEGSKLPFFCVHEFFGNVLCYLNLARHLGDDQPFYALQPRGLEGTDEPFTDVVAMAAYYVDIVRRVQPRGPYALGGLCFGGVIAFEMAQQLQAKGEKVSVVALLDSGIGLNVGRFQWWRRFFQNLPGDFRSWITGSLQLTSTQWLEVIKIKTAVAKGQLEGVFRLPAGGQPNDVPAQLKRLGDVFQFSDRQQRVARAQYRALKNYQPQRFTGRLTLFRARMQPFFSSHDPHKGWSRVAAGGVNVKNIPGNHLGMLQEPHVQILAKELSACLEKASREG